MSGDIGQRKDVQREDGHQHLDAHGFEHRLPAGPQGLEEAQHDEGLGTAGLDLFGAVEPFLKETEQPGFDLAESLPARDGERVEPVEGQQ
ncbi:MAG TPA: hypothetical protein VLA32_00090, partial [Anaerolineales bacterium]|nr:hypothetical protein [Anaerolineales bacterium]